MKYMIHACPARMWYVENFLIPSMSEQGIDRREVTVWNDEAGVGNLESFVRSMELCGKLPGGVWHLQDDVLIAGDFAERTAADPAGVACGFCFPVQDPCVNFRGGNVPARFMWYSFQCIYIPNELAATFAAWFRNDACRREQYRAKVADRKHDDWFFREFILEKHGDGRVWNMDPNLVDHVDYLIGGTTLSPLRSRKVNRAVYWADAGQVAALEAALRTWRGEG